MVSDKIYDLALPVLKDEALDDESKTDKLEDLFRQGPTSLIGKALEDAVLGALWRWKSANDSTSSPPPMRGATVVRSRSPAPWQSQLRSSTPSNASPRSTSASLAAAPAFTRTKSSTASPFTSPRPSPRLAFATPAIPHSPRLSTYQFSDSSPTTDTYGDYGSENVDWLVSDDASSNASLGDSGFGNNSELMSPYNQEMSPYDMLRSVCGNERSDEELEQILELNGYDLSQTINSLMEAQGMGAEQMAAALQQEQQQRQYLIGKNMSPSSRPATPAGQQKSGIICRYWLSSGYCARADCRFSHDPTMSICKYWMNGNCIAGNSCLFSHDPAQLMQQLNLSNSGASTPLQLPPNFQLQDYDSFPALQPTTSNPYDPALEANQQIMTPPPGLFPTFVPTGPRNAGSRPGSRPGSRHASRAPTPSQPNFQDDNDFPSLGSAANKNGKRHHGKRGGHGHHTQPTPGSLADIVRMSPSPGPNSRDAMRRGLRNNRSFTGSRENSAAAMAIAAPTAIPWLETGDSANRAYLKARAEAFKHGGLRNKFLQSAAQAWNRNDARGAKALSLRGQDENSKMREAHREAARALYEERNLANGGAGAKEIYVDLHGLHPEEAVSYLGACLDEQKGSSKPVYAICGTGHHSKNGKDKVGKAIRTFLNEWRYAFREFSVPGDRNNVGGILGIDPSSYDREVAKRGPIAGSDGDSGVGLNEGLRQDTKITVVAEDPRRRVVGEESGDS